jgi:putative ribosome biogenesis GTPase RsgA
MAGGEDGVSQTFADVEELAEDCRFGDCAHEPEPGCAVLAAERVKMWKARVRDSGNAQP